MRYLLDTSAVISRPTPEEVPDGTEFMISSITLAELNAGINAIADPVKRADRTARLQWISGEFIAIPFTRTEAIMYGQLAARVLAVGRSPRSRLTDLLIASVAATHRMPLITRNPKDFAGSPRWSKWSAWTAASP